MDELLDASGSLLGLALFGGLQREFPWLIFLEGALNFFILV